VKCNLRLPSVLSAMIVLTTDANVCACVSVLCSKYYVLVTFEDRSVAVISSVWLEGANRCYWPAENAGLLARKHGSVQQSWMLFPCRILCVSG